MEMIDRKRARKREPREYNTLSRKLYTLFAVESAVKTGVDYPEVESFAQIVDFFSPTTLG